MTEKKSRPAAPVVGPYVDDHSLLEELEVELGIKTCPTHDVDFGGHKYTLRKLDYKGVTLANRLVRLRQEELFIATANEVEVRVALAFSSAALAAIDGRPTYRIFNIVPPTKSDSELSIYNPLDPPDEIKEKTAYALVAFFQKIKRVKLIDALWDAYETHLDDKNDPDTDKFNFDRNQLESLNRAALEELAIRLRIPGLDDMGKPQIIDAILERQDLMGEQDDAFEQIVAGEGDQPKPEDDEDADPLAESSRETPASIGG